MAQRIAVIATIIILGIAIGCNSLILNQLSHRLGVSSKWTSQANQKTCLNKDMHLFSSPTDKKDADSPSNNPEVNKVNTERIEKSESSSLADDAINAPIGPMPTVSSKINFPKDALNINYDLWVCGAGTLGELIVKEWRAMRPQDRILAETRSTNRHSLYNSIGVIPQLRENRSDSDVRTAKTVIIAIPPSAGGKSGYDYKSGYLDELSEAARLWAGPDGGGSLIFTSSIGIYGDSFGNTVTEDFRVHSTSSKSMNLIFAEEAVTTRGGAVTRLAGLYLEKRGPHSYWLTQESIDGAADGLINMVHYEDAARAVIKAALYNAGKVSPALAPEGMTEAYSTNSFQKVFLVCDDSPVSRKDICEAAIDSGLFPLAKVPKFTAESGPKSKVCDSSVTRRLLQWKPKYKSFQYYMRTVIGGLPDLDTSDEENAPKKASGSLWVPGDDDENVEFQL